MTTRDEFMVALGRAGVSLGMVPTIEKLIRQARTIDRANHAMSDGDAVAEADVVDCPGARGGVCACECDPHHPVPRFMVERALAAVRVRELCNELKCVEATIEGDPRGPAVSIRLGELASLLAVPIGGGA